MALEGIRHTGQDDPACARGLDAQIVARLESRALERIDRDRGLVLGADASLPSPSRKLYCVHDG
jgi:hypothetical protein